MQKKLRRWHWVSFKPWVHLVHTVHKHLFLMRQDACKMRALQAAFPFSCVPCAPMGEVFVALPLEFVPAIVTRLCVWKKQGRGLLNSPTSFHLASGIYVLVRRPKPISMQCLWNYILIKFDHDDEDSMITTAQMIPAKWVAVHLWTEKAVF